MQLISDISKDQRFEKPGTGSYEWWYFDAVDDSSRYQLVVIFYEGNPFSSEYIKAMADEKAVPEQFPAVSISIYKDSEPIYYSFTEFTEPDTVFGENPLEVAIGNHKMSQSISNGKLTYRLSLDEILPSGDAIEAVLTFSSPSGTKGPFNRADKQEKSGHLWNLIQPRAGVHGQIQVTKANGSSEKIKFKGTGYHDHNVGWEPMKTEFKDWYWGRFHFSEYTLVYYVMNRRHGRQYEGWLIDNESFEIAETFNDITVTDSSYNLFGLKSCRKIILEGEKNNATVQLDTVLDSGPFYQRFSGDAFLSGKGAKSIQKSSGLAEYIRPDRIYQRLFWPLVNMRIRYTQKGPHWVQRNPVLYRWTW